MLLNHISYSPSLKAYSRPKVHATPRLSECRDFQNQLNYGGLPELQRRYGYAVGFLEQANRGVLKDAEIAEGMRTPCIRALPSPWAQKPLSKARPGWRFFSLPRCAITLGLANKTPLVVKHRWCQWKNVNTTNCAPVIQVFTCHYEDCATESTGAIRTSRSPAGKLVTTWRSAVSEYPTNMKVKCGAWGIGHVPMRLPGNQGWHLVGAANVFGTNSCSRNRGSELPLPRSQGQEGSC